MMRGDCWGQPGYFHLMTEATHFLEQLTGTLSPYDVHFPCFSSALAGHTTLWSLSLPLAARPPFCVPEVWLSGLPTTVDSEQKCPNS